MCDAMYNSLKGTYLSPPESECEWLKISAQFEEGRNMPRVIVAIGEKCVRIKCPKLAGSQYFNYKGFYCMVLLAVFDANYSFKLVQNVHHFIFSGTKSLL